MAQTTPLAPLIAPSSVAPRARGAVRAPKTAELVARTLRRMVVDGRLKEGDFLPNEAELMNHFGVSRPTLREAVRVLENERLVEVRRGSRTGARVRVPGAEIVARPAGLLLEVSGATIADVLVAREGIEPSAARLLAENGTEEAFDELSAIVREVLPEAWESGRLAEAIGHFHLRMVELSGNATLGMIAGMLHEITVRHTDVTLSRKQAPKTQYERLIKSYRRLIDLVRAGNGEEAEAHWRKHMHNIREFTLRGQETIKVRDVME